jgi:hypothetical protein
MNYIAGEELTLEQASKLEGTDITALVLLKSPIFTPKDVFTPMGRYFARLFPLKDLMSVYFPNRYIWEDMAITSSIDAGIVVIDTMECGS